MLRLIPVLWTILGSLTCIICCQKEKFELPIIDNISGSSFYVGDTIRINYVIDGDYDSVCLVISDTLWFTNNPSDNYFVFVAEQSGVFEAILKVYLDSEIIKSRSLGSYSVIFVGAPIKINFTHYDGSYVYFVGDKIKISILPEWPDGDLSNFRETTVYLNETSLGTLKSLPFTFISYPIENDTNRIKVVMIDEENHTYTTETLLIVPVNTPPQIDYNFLTQGIVYPGFYFSTDPVVLSTNGTDNIRVEYIRYYLDNNLIFIDNIKLDQFNLRPLELGTLSAGTHTSYCVAYDNRGDSTVSETLEIIVYKSIEINERISDLVKTDNRNLMYAVSKLSMFIIDPYGEKIMERLNLPYSGATSLDYDPYGEKVFIGFDNGNLICYDEVSKQFHVPITFPHAISDIGLCSDLRICMVISGNSIYHMNIESGECITTPVYLDGGSKLQVMNQNHEVFAGGRPGTSSGFIYRLSFNEDTINYIMRKDIGGYSKGLQLKPDNSELVVLNTNTFGLFSYFTNNLDQKGIYTNPYSVTGAYNTAGNYFYSANSEKQLKKFDTDTYENLFTYYFSLGTYDKIEQLITNADDTRIVFSTSDVFNENIVRLVFIRTD